MYSIGTYGEKSTQKFLSFTLQRWKLPFCHVLSENRFFYNEDEKMSEGGGVQCS